MPQCLERKAASAVPVRGIPLRPSRRRSRMSASARRRTTTRTPGPRSVPPEPRTSKAPNHVNPGWSTEGGSAGGVAGTPNASNPSRRACSASSIVSRRTRPVHDHILVGNGPGVAGGRPAERRSCRCTATSARPVCDGARQRPGPPQLTITRTRDRARPDRPVGGHLHAPGPLSGSKVAAQTSFLDFKGHALTVGEPQRRAS